LKSHLQLRTSLHVNTGDELRCSRGVSSCNWFEWHHPYQVYIFTWRKHIAS